MFIDFSGKPVIYHKIESSFQPYFTKSEQEEIVHSLYDPSAWDGVTTRLEAFEVGPEKISLTISPSSFFESLCSNNLLYMDASALKGNLSKKVQTYQAKMRAKDFQPKNFLEEKYLANSTALSFVLRDRDGRILLTQRTDKVAVAKGYYSVSVAGTVDGEDFKSADPIRSCAIHELEEELNIHLKADDITIQGLYIDNQTCKPSFLATGQLTTPFALDKMKSGADFDNEVADLFVVEPNNLEKFKDKTFTNGAMEQLRLFR